MYRLFSRVSLSPTTTDQLGITHLAVDRVVLDTDVAFLILKQRLTGRPAGWLAEETHR